MFIYYWLAKKPFFTKQFTWVFGEKFSHQKLSSPKIRFSAHDAGFTLIEIMVVIAIIGILATMIIPRIMGRPDEARATAAKHDVGTLVQSLKIYRLDIGRYPTSEQGLTALVEKPSANRVPQNWKAGGYLDSLPKDPWGNPYQYLAPGVHGEVDLFSYGADGQPGGTGNDADIGSWAD